MTSIIRKNANKLLNNIKLYDNYISTRLILSLNQLKLITYNNNNIIIIFLYIIQFAYAKLRVPGMECMDLVLNFLTRAWQWSVWNLVLNFLTRTIGNEPKKNQKKRRKTF